MERAVIGLEPQHRVAGDGHPTVRAGGGRAWLEDMEGEAYHPSALSPNEDLSDEQREECWLWETCGYLILRNVMDPSEDIYLSIYLSMHV